MYEDFLVEAVFFLYRGNVKTVGEVQYPKDLISLAMSSHRLVRTGEMTLKILPAVHRGTAKS